MISTPNEYWSSGAGLDHITPPGDPWPEGPEFEGHVRELTSGRSVLEFGCGVGRLAHLFEPKRYTGMDICSKAIEIAEARHPNYLFVWIDDQVILPEVDVTFAHNVLMHIPDDLLFATIGRFTSERVVVSEILGRRWRGPGAPPVFNRELAEYRDAFAPVYRIARVLLCPCARYKTHISMLEFAAR